MSASSKNASPVCKTAFVVLWDKSIENMGIKVNWNDLDYMQAQLETAFRDSSESFYATICKAGNEQGKGHHVHLAISYDKARRLSAIAKELGNAHTEMMRGTKEEAIAYVNKEGKYAEKDETVLAHIGKASSVTDNSGQRIDYKAIQKDIEDGLINAGNLRVKALELAGSNPTTTDKIERLYLQTIRAKADKTNGRNVKVTYVEGRTGTGKTHLAIEQAKGDYFIADVSEKTSFPFNGYIGQKTLILDELRPGIFKPAELFRYLDKHRLDVNVKGGQFPAMWTQVIISTACPLQDWFKKDEDNYGQDNNREQFQRRIHEHYRAVVDESDQETGETKKSHWERIYDLPRDKKRAHDQTDFRPLTEAEERDNPFH